MLHNRAAILSNFSAIAALSLLFLWQKCSLCWSPFFTSFQRGLLWRNITQEQFLKMDVVQLLNISSVTVYLNAIVSYSFSFLACPGTLGGLWNNGGDQAGNQTSYHQVCLVGHVKFICRHGCAVKWFFFLFVSSCNEVIICKGSWKANPWGQSGVQSWDWVEIYRRCWPWVGCSLAECSLIDDVITVKSVVGTAWVIERSKGHWRVKSNKKESSPNRCG